MTSWPNGLQTIPRVTDEFGPRPGRPVPGVKPFHSGIDLVGFAINRSPCDGIVTFASYNGTAGNHIEITGYNGDVFDLFHNASFLVERGYRVRERDGVGVQGTTGASTGVHCHFECHPGGGAAVNPRDYMAAAIGSGNAAAGTPVAPIELKGNNVANIIYLINAARTDQAVYAMNLDEIDEPIWQITGYEFAAKDKRGIPFMEYSAADFLFILKTRGIYTLDSNYRRRFFSPDTVNSLPDATAKSRAFDYKGWLAGRIH